MTRVFVSVAAVAGLLLVPCTAATAPGAQQRCVDRIVYQGTVYSASLPRHVVRPGARVGRAVRPGCTDVVGLPLPPTEQVDVFRFGTASPQVALTNHRGVRFAVGGRCSGFPNRADYHECLQTEVRFRGRGYTGTRGPILTRGGVLGQGRVRGRPVLLHAIEGVDPRIALVREDDPHLILVAHRRCQMSPSGPTLTSFTRCLRAPLWLAVRGHGRSRTATIQAPGSLLEGVRIQLFLAPDGVADEITWSQDERLTPAGRLIVDGRGGGTARIQIAESLGAGRYAVVAQLPGRRVIVVGVLALSL
jgi:hypothetical protein